MEPELKDDYWLKLELCQRSMEWEAFVRQFDQITTLTIANVAPINHLRFTGMTQGVGSSFN